MTDSAALLGADGPFAAALDQFRVRVGQQALATAIEETLADRSILVAEAGTGVGKTFAYLVPVVDSGVRAVISTGTKTLQDQLFHRDLPAVMNVLGTQRRTALLKGRANYVCHYRVEQHGRKAAGEGLMAVARHEKLRRWMETTRSGDLAEFPEASDHAEWRHQVSSTADNCLGSECPYYSECFLVRARQRAQAADIVVVNHHLLFADMALRREGFGELLPDVAAVVVDEAHRVPDTATQFFGKDLSSRMLRELVTDTRTEAAEISGGLPAVLAPCEELEAAARDLRLSLESLPARGTWDGDAAEGALARLDAALTDLIAGLEGLAGATRGAESCLLRAREQALRLQALDAPEPDTVVWYERSARGFAFHLTPLDISRDLEAHRCGLDAAWIFTSATLAVGDRFDLFSRRMGLDEPRAERFDSPFDFETHALVYQPPNMPEPGSPQFVDRLIDAIHPVLDLTGGGAFLLFTSHRNLQYAAARLRRIGRWPLFVQGEAPRPQLLESFKAVDDGLLLGAASFWEGVDVAGSALRCVVIDKLPFAAPDDPVLQARVKAIREAGGDPFHKEQLPQAVLTLKQGFGRLIRSETDSGIVVIGDPRIRTRGYGRSFLASLPPAPLTDNLLDLQRFLRDRMQDDRRRSTTPG